MNNDIERYNFWHSEMDAIKEKRDAMILDTIRRWDPVTNKVPFNQYVASIDPVDDNGEPMIFNTETGEVVFPKKVLPLSKTFNL
jgi:hypothetical protein